VTKVCYHFLKSHRRCSCTQDQTRVPANLCRPRAFSLLFSQDLSLSLQSPLSLNSSLPFPAVSFSLFLPQGYSCSFRCAYPTSYTEPWVPSLWWKRSRSVVAAECPPPSQFSSLWAEVEVNITGTSLASVNGT
jgi:hypothetical protein